MELSIELTQNQMAILQDNHRFKVVDCGRQFGKSHLAACFAIAKSLSEPNTVGWVISPTYRQSGYLFDKVVQLCKEHKIPISVKKSNQEMIVTFTLTGSKFQALSGDDPDKLRGQTLSYLVVDEAAMMSDDVWKEHLRPMTAVYKSPVLFLSTPKGKNWFYDLYVLGLNENEGSQWKSFHYTSYDGIIVSKDPIGGRKELDVIKSETDDLTWRQEYLGEFLDSGGIVFTHYKTRALSYNCNLETTYFVSIDLAKHGDYTVLFVADCESKEIVDMWRATGLSWESQLARFKEINTIYHNPRFFIDSTGLGDPILERMIDEGFDAQGFTFSSKSKQQMVQNLAVMLQREELLIPDDRYVKDEIDRYQFEHTPTGQFRYSAPDGYHDDCVSSLLILAWAISKVPKDVGFLYEETEQTESYEVESEFDWTDLSDKLDWDDSEYRLWN